MFRFINLKNQIMDETPSFAFYDTVKDKFIELAGTQVWDSWGEFEEFYNLEAGNKPDLERLRRKVPLDYFDYC
ncbi:MAG TPA: hypothetical protein VF668_01280 [Pyrinomonadaceae bacterium]|jgi:hypothetical protein